LRPIGRASLIATRAEFHRLIPNIVYGSKFLTGWRVRYSHAGLVPYPLATGRGIYTIPQNASDLAALNGLLVSAAPSGATIFDLSIE
jgi:hypothetical protein